MTFGDLDWIDIALHVGVTLAVMALGFWVSWALAVTLVWLLRELEQHRWRLGGIQSNLEWVLPGVLAGAFEILVMR